MPELTLDEENLLARAGIADRNFADHSGNIQQGYELGSLTRGLVAYYPMEEGQGQVLHDGALDNLGQINGATWNGSGQVGSNMLGFDQTNSEYVSTEYIVSSPITFSAWINFDTDPVADGDEQQIVGADDGTDFFDLAYLSGDVWRWGTFNSSTGAHRTQPSDSIDVDTWYHAVGTYDGSTYRMFVNAVEVGSAVDSSFTAPDSTPVYIGANNASGTPEAFFNGQIDDVRIYDRALSQPEIEALYNLGQLSGFLVEERDLVTYPEPAAFARFEFEGDVTDSWSGIEATDNTSAGFVDGVFGQAKDFNGTSDYLTIDGTAELSINQFTVSWWFNGDTIETTGDGDQYIFDDYDAGNDIGTRIGTQSVDTAYGVSARNNGSVIKTEVPLSEFSNNSWNHSCVTINNGKFRLYTNGSLAGEDSTTSEINQNAHDFGIGAETRQQNYFDGQVDDLRIYERALDPIEVETLFNKGAYRINRGEL